MSRSRASLSANKWPSIHSMGARIAAAVRSQNRQSLARDLGSDVLRMRHRHAANPGSSEVCCKQARARVARKHPRLTCETAHYRRLHMFRGAGRRPTEKHAEREQSSRFAIERATAHSAWSAFLAPCSSAHCTERSQSILKTWMCPHYDCHLLRVTWSLPIWR